MSFIGIDKHLLNAVKDGNIERAKAALEAGANVDGSRVLPCAPLLAATIANHVGMVDLLLRQSADPDTPITEELPHPCPSLDYAVAIPGERALHLAARSGNVEIVRLLLKRSHADPNATDNRLHPTHGDLQKFVRLHESGAAAARGGRRPGLGKQNRATPSAHGGLPW